VRRAGGREGIVIARASLLPMMTAALVAMPAAAQTPRASGETRGPLPGGGDWVVEAPANWNGTVLLYGHGYSQTLRPAESAPSGERELYLAQGYGLAASSYSQAGWALEQAQVDQWTALDAFVARYGKPKRVIAWGDSMGGLTSVALAERHPERLDGALALCGSISGVLGMMNTALDGAFAFKTLLAPDADLRLVATGDDRANGAAAQAILGEAMRTPRGRARIALASALAQLPGWTDPASPEPQVDAYDEQLEQQAKAFVMGVFLPRADQERRAGGVFSWNTGVDYAAQLRAGGRRPAVQALYAKAGLDLDADLATLAKAPRIAAEPVAVAYMSASYTISGDIKRPLLTVHNVGDGMTVVSTNAAYASAVKSRRRGANLAQAFVGGAGHCRFGAGERLAAIRTLEARIDTGRWDAAPAALNRRARDAGEAQGRFVPFTPPPFARPCIRGGACRGAPIKPE
jgi:pimeloyl-ACP methyl ester carboxylesterase